MNNPQASSGGGAVDFFVPAAANVTPEAMWRWYCNIPLELGAGFLTPQDERCLREYYHEGGLLRRGKVDFFREHFSESFARASRYLLDGGDRLTILDLGCGTGTQAIFFALAGARVVGVDMDHEALEVLAKRASFYSGLCGRKLDIQTVYGNALEIDYEAFGPIDGVYSMFAFNMMQPSDALLERIAPSLSDRARIGVIDGNNRSWLGRFVPSRRRDVWSPQQFEEHLRRLGFAVDVHEGGIALLPVVWALPLQALWKGVDRLLRRSWFFAISHQILARRVQP